MLSDEELTEFASDVNHSDLSEAYQGPIRALIAEVKRLRADAPKQELGYVSSAEWCLLNTLRRRGTTGDQGPLDMPRADTFIRLIDAGSEREEEAERVDWKLEEATENLRKANRWLAHLERELEAATGERPRIADLVEAQDAAARARGEYVPEMEAPARPPGTGSVRPPATISVHAHERMLPGESVPQARRRLDREAAQALALERDSRDPSRIGLIVGGKEVARWRSHPLSAEFSPEATKRLADRLSAEVINKPLTERLVHHVIAIVSAAFAECDPPWERVREEPGNG